MWKASHNMGSFSQNMWSRISHHTGSCSLNMSSCSHHISQREAVYTIMWYIIMWRSSHSMGSFSQNMWSRISHHTWSCSHNMSSCSHHISQWKLFTPKCGTVYTHMDLFTQYVELFTPHQSAGSCLHETECGTIYTIRHGPRESDWCFFFLSSD